jgi:ribonuclease HI
MSQSIIKVYSDAAWSKEKGEVYLGCVLEDEEGACNFSTYRKVVINSSCEAEYLGVCFALDQCKEHGYKVVSLLSDSKIVVNQLNNRMKCRTKELQGYHDLVFLFLNKYFVDWEIRFVPGEKNPADKPCRKLKKERLNEESIES